jgi:uncharacterized protein
VCKDTLRKAGDGGLTRFAPKLLARWKRWLSRNHSSRELEMERTIVARWREWSGEGVEQLVLHERPDRILAEGVVFATAAPNRFAATYQIECDAKWRVKTTHARVIGVDAAIDLMSDGAGRWRDAGGLPLPNLDGAIDVDLSITPFTNTLPIRRLGLAEGQRADIRAVYLRLPDLTLTIDRQRYTCLIRDRQYRYESLDSDFARDIDIDADGLVVTYPGLFRRVV